ncbi:MAG: hypothetical protein ACFCVE_13455 [Phycisphaerae bacterium]
MAVAVLATVAAVGISVGTSGCDPEADRPATPASQRPGFPTPPATPDDASPTEEVSRFSYFQIDGNLVAFPPAKLEVKPDDGIVIAGMFSDDPPDAVRPNYQGNSFYFRMDLYNIERPEQLTETVWYFTASAGEDEQTLNGVFLHGRNLSYTPRDVAVRFDSVEGSDALDVVLDGEFVERPLTGAGAERRVEVRADIRVTPNVRK